MSDIAISVENLSKKYHIGRARQRHDTLRDALVAGLQAPFQRLRRNGEQPEDDTIWALKDVSFEVKRGEVVGVIGRNGAGKSTLLKILTQITEPTAGRAVLNGRVGSLLEVGTGFHQELTGRENVYLSGAILGMRRAEIDRKFDEIVDFSGVEKFIDTPVKRYSSGMKVRLGFAVAAHLEPEILLIDEVLAVGDAEFQKKCLGKMGSVAKEGRTVLFVSHNMAAIGQLCKRSLLIASGNVEFDGAAERAIARNLAGSHETRGPIWGIGTVQHDDVPVRISSVSCAPVAPFIGTPLTITIAYSAESAPTGFRFGVSIENSLGQRVTGSYSGREGVPTRFASGNQFASIFFPTMNLVPGTYFVTVAIHDQEDENLVRLERAASFEVVARDLSNSGHLVDQSSGIVWLGHEWRV